MPLLLLLLLLMVLMMLDAGCCRRPRMSCAGHGEVARVSSTTKLITIHHPHRITSLLQCRIQAAAHQICIARDLLRH